jgi:hypothetical protein
MTNMNVGERATVMVRSSGSGAAAPGGHTDQTQAAAGLERIEAAIDTARSEPARPDSAQFLVALALLRQVREQLAGWEPELIEAARASGASWAQLAPALGVASRQAAERRALRLRPGADAAATTGDQRVSAERDRRAGVRAVDAYARDHSADLRVLAAQVGGVTGLPEAADAPMAALHAALGGADAAALLAPLRDARAHLGDGHEHLTERIDALSGAAEDARADAQAQRRR